MSNLHIPDLMYKELDARPSHCVSEPAHCFKFVQVSDKLLVKTLGGTVYTVSEEMRPNAL